MKTRGMRNWVGNDMLWVVPIVVVLVATCWLVLYSDPVAPSVADLPSEGRGRGPQANNERKGGAPAKGDVQIAASSIEFVHDHEVRFSHGWGGDVTGKASLVQSEPDGSVRLGGAIVGGRKGSFFLKKAGQRIEGMLLLPEEKLVFQFVTKSDGRLEVVRKLLSEVICHPMPRYDDEKTKPKDGDGGRAEMPPPAEYAPPLLSSRPDATAVLYLDFDGETVTDPAWNNGFPIIAAPAYLTSDEITEIWRRVKEDFWPFSIDVTTDLNRYLNAPVGRRMRVIVTPTDTARPGVGGVAYVDCFSAAGGLFSSTIPCWVFNGGIVGASETISHEVGHTLGLRHDGRPGQEYYLGHGSDAVGWAPIMGVGFYQQLVQWSRGEYADANNHEDDLARIARPANGFGYVSDEAGDTMATAASLGVAGGSIQQTGIISGGGDRDCYLLQVSLQSQVDIAVRPTASSPNLDVLVELIDGGGNLIANSNPDLALDGMISVVLPPGSYGLRISGTGRGNVLEDGYSSYGSIGHYGIEGTITTLGIPVILGSGTAEGVTGASFFHQLVATNSPTGYVVIGTLPPGLAFNWATGVISGTPVSAGTYPLLVGATNSIGTGMGNLKITIENGAYFRNQAAISIPYSGGSNPYPATIDVSGISSSVERVIVRLHGFSHTYPSDVDVLLVGPGGQAVLLLSDVGSGTSVTGVDLAFDDDAVEYVGSPVVSGVFRPTNLGEGDAFGPGAPSPPYGGSLSVFKQINPNGVWKLFVWDDVGGDLGAVGGGWSITFVTPDPVLSVSPVEMTTPEYGEFHSFEVSASGAWTWSASEPWILSNEPVNQFGNQSFDYAVAGNPSASGRSATITLTSGGLTATHTIVQAGSSSSSHLIQNLADGSQSVWWPQAGGSSIEDATLVNESGFHDDAFDGAGLLDVRTRAEFGNVAAGKLWGNYELPAQTGSFSAIFTTTPSSGSMDTVIGFSNGPADFWDDLAAYVRFNDQGKVDARDGGGFAAVNQLNYLANVTYTVEMEVNVATRRYRATVKPFGGVPVVIADNYAFRSEQGAVSQLTNFAYLTWSGGTQWIGALTLPSLGSRVSGNVWGNHPIRPRNRTLVATFSTTPSSNAMDTSIGFSSAAADFWDDLAAYVRFNPQGRIDARNGDGFAAANVMNYSAGVSYSVAFEIDVQAKLYWATVTADGGSPVLIADHFAFRTEQSGVTQLANFAYLTWSGGTQTVGMLRVSDIGTVTANNLWGNLALDSQAGIFLASFKTMPGSASVDTTVGFSSGAADFWDDLAAYVRFNPQGKVDARNGNGFAALTDLTYQAGVTYLVEMEVNVPLKRFSATVTPAGGDPCLIARDFAFRTEQNSVTQISNFTYLTWTGGVQTVADFAITGSRIELPALSLDPYNETLSASAWADGVECTKEIRLLSGRHAVDEIISLRNTLAVARRVTLSLRDNYGSDISTVVHHSSSGDRSVGPDDHWFVSNDQTDPVAVSIDPSLFVSWVHSPGLSSMVLSEVPGSGGDWLGMSFVATLEAGKTETLVIRRELFDSAWNAILGGQPLGSGATDLVDLDVSAGPLSPAFQATITEYQVPIHHYRSTTFAVRPVVAAEGATVAVNGVPVTSGTYSNPVALAVGENAITIRVTSPDGGSFKDYVVHVARAWSAIQGWRMHWFGTYANEGNAADDFDFDHDGVSNLLEFAFGLDPTLGSSCQIPKGRWINGQLVFVIDSFRIDNEELIYGAEWSATMKTGDWHDIPDSDPDVFLHEFIVPNDVGPRGFVRFKVTSDGE